MAAGVDGWLHRIQSVVVVVDSVSEGLAGLVRTAAGGGIGKPNDRMRTRVFQHTLIPQRTERRLVVDRHDVDIQRVTVSQGSVVGARR